MNRFRNVEEYLVSHKNYRDELEQLRTIVCSTGLEETLKWGAPVYMYKGNNIVGIGAFRSYFGLWFFQGSFLKDDLGVLINAQEGKTRGLRQWRFASKEEINKELIKAYIFEAIKNQNAGLEIKPVAKEVPLAPELRSAFREDPDLESVFSTLTPGRQKEYSEYISEAKKAETRQNRLLKCIPLIRKGMGLNDKYR